MLKTKINQQNLFCREQIILITALILKKLQKFLIPLRQQGSFFVFKIFTAIVLHKVEKMYSYLQVLVNIFFSSNCIQLFNKIRRSWHKFRKKGGKTEDQFCLRNRFTDQYSMADALHTSCSYFFYFLRLSQCNSKQAIFSEFIL